MNRPTKLAATLATLALSFTFSITTADEFVWTGGAGNSNWSDPGNWNNVTPGGTAQFPTLGDSASFPIDATINSGAATNLATAFGVTITKQVNTSTTLEGTINNQGVLSFQRDDLNNALGGIIDTEFRIDSAVSLTGGGEVILNGFKSGFEGSGTLTNVDNLIRGDGTFAVATINQGTLSAQGGRLSAFNSITGTGFIEIASGAEFEFNGDVLQQSQITVDPSGTFDFNGNRLEVLDFVGDFNHDIGTYAPGASPEISTLSGNYNATGGFLEIEIEGNQLGEFDQLLVGGDVSLGGVDLSVVSQSGFTATPGDVFGIVSVGGTRSGFFNNGSLVEGATAGTLGSQLRITYAAGDGNDIALFTTTNATSVNFNTAGLGDDVFFVGNRGLTTDANTFEFGDFEVLNGQGFTLGPHETLVLDGGNGTLFINEGAVFSGNGIIDGSVFNAGLFRIPIVRLQNIARVTGGVVSIAPPAPADPSQDFDEPIEVQEDTYLRFGDVGQPGGGGGSTGGSFVIGGGGPAGTPGGGSISNNGTVGFSFDANVVVTGSYEQTDTGALRLFIAGQNPGIDYSQLIVGENVYLDGEIQIVFRPELFAEFGYAPKIGQTFDFILSGEGIEIDPSGMLITNFVTVEGASLLAGMNFSPFNSGFAADPDNLLQIEEILFSVELVENDTILRATLIQNVFSVPEPSSATMVTLVACTWLARRRNRSNERTMRSIVAMH